MDIVVATPTSLLAQMRAGHVAIGDVQYLVVDEADTMFDHGFGPELFDVVGPLKKRGVPLAAILVSATMSAPVKELARREFPGMLSAETSSLHKGISGSNHTFVPMRPNGNRMDSVTQVCSLTARNKPLPQLLHCLHASRCHNCCTACMLA